MQNRKIQRIIAAATAIVLFGMGTVASLTTRSSAMEQTPMRIVVGEGLDQDSSSGGLVLDKDNSQDPSKELQQGAGDKDGASGSLTVGQETESQNSLTLNTAQSQLQVLDDSETTEVQTESGAQNDPDPVPDPDPVSDQDPDDADAEVEAIPDEDDEEDEELETTTPDHDPFTPMADGYCGVTTYQELVECVLLKNTDDSVKTIKIRFLNDIPAIKIKDEANRKADRHLDYIPYAKDLIVDGKSPSGKICSFIQFDDNNSFRPKANDLSLTLKNMKIDIADHYGIARSTAGRTGGTVCFDTVSFSGPQAVRSYRADNKVIIKGVCDFQVVERQRGKGSGYLTVPYGRDQTQYKVYWHSRYTDRTFIQAGQIIFDEDSDITIHCADSSYAIFWFRDTNSLFHLKENAKVQVTGDKKKSLFYFSSNNIKRNKPQLILDRNSSFIYQGYRYGYGGSVTRSSWHTVDIGPGATFIIDATYSPKACLTVRGGRMTVAENAVVYLSGGNHVYRTLFLRENAELSVTNPKFFGLNGHIEGQHTNISVQAQVLNYWAENLRTDPKVLCDPDGALQTAPIEYIPASSLAKQKYYRTIYGQNQVNIDSITSFQDSFQGTTTPQASLKKVRYTPNLTEPAAPQEKTIENLAVEANGSFTVRPDTTGMSIPAGYGCFKNGTYVTVDAVVPAPNPLIKEFPLWAEIRKMVTDSDHFRLTVGNLDYGTVTYAGYTKMYGLMHDAKLEIRDTRFMVDSSKKFSFVLTATATKFSNGQSQLEHSTIGYINQDNEYMPMTDNSVKIGDSKSVASTNGIYAIDLNKDAVAPQQIVVRLNPYEKIQMNTVYTTNIHWTLSPSGEL